MDMKLTKGSIMQEDSVFSKATTTTKQGQKGIFDELKLANIFL
jgi:hypothetical protein